MPIDLAILCYNPFSMLLITGGTGFVGRHLIPILVRQGIPVRLLIRPSADTPQIPKGVSVEVAVSNITDQRGIRAALKGVEGVIHLVSTERNGSNAEFNHVDIEGARNLVDAIRNTKKIPIYYLSHLKATRTSAYPYLKTKAIIEGLIQSSDLPFVILRSAIMFGQGDQFTYPLKKAMQRMPFIFGIPERGKSLLQPISVMDIVNCLGLCINDPSYRMQVIEVGGLEYFAYKRIVDIVMSQFRLKRRIVNISPILLRNLSFLSEQLFDRAVIPYNFWDYLAENRICALDSVTTHFGIIPSRFEYSLGYLIKSNPKEV